MEEACTSRTLQDTRRSLVKTQSDSSQDQVEYLPILPTTSNHKTFCIQATKRPVSTPSAWPQKPAPHRNRRFQQPQYYLGIQHHRRQRRSGRGVGGFMRFHTHPRRETTEIIQQCSMEERLQPGPHICI